MKQMEEYLISRTLNDLESGINTDFLNVVRNYCKEHIQESYVSSNLKSHFKTAYTNMVSESNILGKVLFKTSYWLSSVGAGYSINQLLENEDISLGVVGFIVGVTGMGLIKAADRIKNHKIQGYKESFVDSDISDWNTALVNVKDDLATLVQENSD